MSEKIADFKNNHKGTSFAEGEDGKLIEISNWESDGDIDVYGAVYGSLKVVHDINDPDADSGNLFMGRRRFLAGRLKDHRFP